MKISVAGSFGFVCSKTKYVRWNLLDCEEPVRALNSVSQKLLVVGKNTTCSTNINLTRAMLCSVYLYSQLKRTQTLKYHYCNYFCPLCSPSFNSDISHCLLSLWALAEKQWQILLEAFQNISSHRLSKYSLLNSKGLSTSTFIYTSWEKQVFRKNW